MRSKSLKHLFTVNFLLQTTTSCVCVMSYEGEEIFLAVPLIKLEENRSHACSLYASKTITPHGYLDIFKSARVSHLSFHIFWWSTEAAGYCIWITKKNTLETVSIFPSVFFSCYFTHLSDEKCENCLRFVCGHENYYGNVPNSTDVMQQVMTF